MLELGGLGRARKSFVGPGGLVGGPVNCQLEISSKEISDFKQSSGIELIFLLLVNIVMVTHFIC